MNYKLVAIDLDGTLLDPQLKISPQNMSTIKRAINQGVIVTLSTGRMYAAALPIAKQLQLDVPIITCNGAAIICAESKKVYYEKFIPWDLIMQIINWGKRLGLVISLYTVDDIFVEERGQNEEIHGEIDNAQVKVVKFEELLEKVNIIKILFSSKNLYQHAEEVYHMFGRECTFYFSLPYFVEIVASGVDKGDALEELAKKFNVKQQEIIAIGDNFNDLPMIEYAGLGVAMGNAPEDLKVQADYVTRSYDDDGVAYVFEKFVIKTPVGI